MTQSYKTNKHARNSSIEEQLERAIDLLDERVSSFDPDDEINFQLDSNVINAENLDEAYRRVCDDITKLERFREWLRFL